MEMPSKFFAKIAFVSPASEKSVAVKENKEKRDANMYDGELRKEE